MKREKAIGLNKSFTVDGSEYVLVIDDDGEVCFAWYDRHSTPYPPEPHYFELFPEEKDNARYTLGDANVGANSMRVFRVVCAEVIRWTKRYRPHMVWFRPCNERRAEIYAWLAKRIINRLPEYNHYRLNGTFYFFRKADPTTGLTHAINS